MSIKIQKRTAAPAAKSATGSSRSAVLAAVSLLSVSMCVSLSDTAKAETIRQDKDANKLKTSDKKQKEVLDFVKGRRTPGGPGATEPTKPVGSKNRK